MSKINIPSFDDLLAQLNMEAVAEAIMQPRKEGEKPPRYNLDEFENIKEMILLAAEKWLGRDLVEFNITSIEEENRYVPEGNIGEYKAFFDVQTTLNGIVKPYTDYKGQICIVDWKTRDGELDQRWRTRLIDSWQWKIYAAISGAKIFNYRGISRRCNLSDTPTKEILIEVPPTVKDEVNEYFAGLYAQRQGLIGSNINVWPRNFDACFDYGRECPFKMDCDEYTMPRYVPQEGKVMSYTSLKYFQRCNEFSRRMLGEPTADDTEDSNIGAGFHSGVANLWGQARHITL